MRRNRIFPVAILALSAFVLAACGEDYVPKGEFAVGKKLENFTLPDLSGTQQSLDKLKTGLFWFGFQRSARSLKYTTKGSIRRLMN